MSSVSSTFVLRSKQVKKVLANLTSLKQETKGVMIRAKGTNRTPHAWGHHHSSVAVQTSEQSGPALIITYHCTVTVAGDRGHSEGGPACKETK